MRAWRVFMTSLGVLNLLNLIAAGLIITFAVSISNETDTSHSTDTDTDGQVHLLVITLILLGSLLTVSATFGFIGTLSPTCTCLLLLSSYTISAIITLELCSALYLTVQEQPFNDWIKEHQDELNLTDDGVNAIKDRTIFGIFFLIGCSLLECCRFATLRKVRNQILAGHNGHREQLLEERKEEQTETLKVKLLVEEKYSDLRRKYKERYSFDAGDGSAGAESGLLDLNSSEAGYNEMPIIVDL